MKLSSLLLLSFAFITQYTRSHEPHDSNKAANDPNSDYDPSSIKIIEENIVKPVLDNSEYKVVELPNGIETVLISDPSTTKSAASLSVLVGNREDPDNFPGLAHFCEHLLFMGTQKYPDEDDYRNFLSLHDGEYNAYTTIDHTNYFFDIHSKYFYQQLDRLANFFIKPLFRNDSVTRESHAITSEYERHHLDISWYRYYFLQSLLSTVGSSSKFSIGTRQTLFSHPRAMNLSVRDALEKFFNDYYLSRHMKLAIYGKESLDTLQKWALETFGKIPNKGPRNVSLINPIEKLNRSHYWYKAHGPALLHLIFAVPTIYSHNSAPQHYLDYILTFQGSKSVSERFRSKYLSSSISTSNIRLNNKYDLYAVTFVLSTVGIRNYTAVIEEFFKCLQFYKDDGPKKEVFQEIMRPQTINFKYSTQSSVIDFVGDLTSIMLYDSLPRKYLLKHSIIKEYNEEEIKSFFSALNPHNFISYASGITKSYNETFPYTNTDYLREDYKEDFLERLKNVTAVPLGYPPRNIYITSDPEVTMEKLNNTLDKPDLIRSTDVSSLWHKHASFFYCPFGIIRILFKNPIVSSSVSNSLKLRLFEFYLNSLIPTERYYTGIAGLNYVTSITAHGLSVSFYGYTDKIMEMFSIFVNLLNQISFSFADFVIYKSYLSSIIRSMNYREPFSFLRSELNNVLSSEKQTSYEELFELNNLDHNKINAFFYEFMTNLHFDILVTGNIPAEDALHVYYMLEQLVPSRGLTPSQYIYPRAITLENDADHFFFYNAAIDEIRSGILVYYEVTEVTDTKKVLLLNMLHSLLHPIVFGQLRTKEQLGYIVHLRINKLRTIQGISVVIQSKRQPHVLHSRIEALFDSILDNLNVTDEDVSHYFEAYMNQLETRPSSIIDESNWIWSQILSGTYYFALDDDDLDPIDPPKLQDLIELFKEVFGSKRRRISYHLSSQTTRDTFNVFDIPLDKLSEYLATQGKNISKDQLYEYVLLSDDIPSFEALLIKHFSEENNDAAKSLVNGTFEFLKNEYSSQRRKFYEPIELVSDMVYFKASSTLSPSFINASLWSKFYKWQ